MQSEHLSVGTPVSLASDGGEKDRSALLVAQRPWKGSYPILPQFALPGGHGVAPLWILPPPRRRVCRGHLFFRPGLSSLVESGLPAVHGQIRLSASAVVHASGRLEVNRCPKTSNLQAAILALTESNWGQINRLLGGQARVEGREDERIARAGVTALDTGIHYPTDSSLLLDGIPWSARVGSSGPYRGKESFPQASRNTPDTPLAETAKSTSRQA